MWIRLMNFYSLALTLVFRPSFFFQSFQFAAVLLGSIMACTSWPATTDEVYVSL